MSDTKLTEAERERLRAVCDDGRQFDEVAHEVRAIVAARLASVKALADEWDLDQNPGIGGGSDPAQTEATPWDNRSGDRPEDPPAPTPSSDAHTEQKGTGDA